MNRRTLSPRARFEVLKRDGFACQYCGGRPPDVILHIDHVEPLARGGADDPINYLTSCGECNLGKAARPVLDDEPCAICLRFVPTVPRSLYELSRTIFPDDADDSDFGPTPVCVVCVFDALQFLLTSRQEARADGRERVA